jgi:hypothetical protein
LTAISGRVSFTACRYSESLDPLCHYVILRADLPRGIQAAQAIHAAGESSPGNLQPGTFAVALTCPSERALVHVADDLRRAGVRFVAIFEPDPPYDGALMALGLAPARKGVLRRHLSKLPLLK